MYQAKAPPRAEDTRPWGAREPLALLRSPSRMTASPPLFERNSSPLMPQDIALVEDPEFKKWVEVYANARARSPARPSRARAP